jgi:hypothetical protein
MATPRADNPESVRPFSTTQCFVFMHSTIFRCKSMALCVGLINQFKYKPIGFNSTSIQHNSIIHSKSTHQQYFVIDIATVVIDTKTHHCRYRMAPIPTPIQSLLLTIILKYTSLSLLMLNIHRYVLSTIRTHINTKCPHIKHSHLKCPHNTLTVP